MLDGGRLPCASPLIHLRFSLVDMLQGFAVAGATGLALVPYFMALLGLDFQEAVVMAMFHSLLISFSWMFFGDPYAPGWLTPAIPFVVAFYHRPGLFRRSYVSVSGDDGVVVKLCVYFS